MKTFLKIVALTAATMSPAMASNIVYSENFNGYPPQLNHAFSAPLSVTNGSVDLVANNTYSIECRGMTGNCVDLDGSTFASGKLSLTLTLDAGNYLLNYWASGNQRGGQSDSLYWSIVGYAPGQISGATSMLNTFLPDDPFVELAATFSLLSAQTLTMNWFTYGNDNIGPIIDDITVSREPVETPEPATLLLLGLGLCGLVMMQRGIKLVEACGRRN